MCVFLHWALPMECNTCPTKTFNLPSESQNLKKIQNSHSLLPTKFPLHWATISTPPVTPLSGRIFQFQSLFSTLPGLLYLLPLSESWLSDFEISHIGFLPGGCPCKKCLLGNSPVNTLAVHFSHFAKISSQVLTQFACLPTKGLSTGHSSTGHSQSTCPWNHFSPDELWFCPISIMPMLNTVPRE